MQDKRKNRISRLIIGIVFCLVIAFGGSGISNNSITSSFAVETHAAAKTAISSKKATIIVGNTKKLKVRNTKKKAKWYSSKKTVATVSKTGKVTAKKAGKARITAKIGKKKYTCVITVKKIALNKKSLKLIEGYSAILKLNNGKKASSWISSNKSVATVSKSGKVTAKKTGTVTITAKYNKKEYKCTVTVLKQDTALADIPAYTGSPYTVINNNIPFFTSSEKANKTAFETYSALDTLGRCGVAYANICKDTKPTDSREDISSVYPSGWQSGMGWERCHLIAFVLAGENANERNLIAGTHYFNATGMQPYEETVHEYVDQKNGHVLYRVTPYFKGNNLIASGVLMEAWSVEDAGQSVCFNIFVHNVQPGKKIDYATGVVTEETPEKDPSESYTYVCNISKKKFHYSTCKSVSDMSEKNKLYVTATREELISMGYEPCGSCKP